jgi:hypothetical protein
MSFFNCLSENSEILMHDNSIKLIKDIKIGDFVKSGRTNDSTIVLYKYKTTVNKQDQLREMKMISINGSLPFITSNHPLISDNNKIITFDNKNPILYSNLEKMNINSIIYKYNTDINQIYEDTIKEIKEYECEDNQILYNIITFEHSFIANGYSVYDECPEVEKNRREASVILLLVIKEKELNLSELKIDEIKQIADCVYETHSKEIIQEVYNMNSIILFTKMTSIFMSNKEHYSKEINHNHTKLVYYLWSNYLLKIKEELLKLEEIQGKIDESNEGSFSFNPLNFLQ